MKSHVYIQREPTDHNTRVVITDERDAPTPNTMVEIMGAQNAQPGGPGDPLQTTVQILTPPGAPEGPRPHVFEAAAGAPAAELAEVERAIGAQRANVDALERAAAAARAELDTLEGRRERAAELVAAQQREHDEAAARVRELTRAAAEDEAAAERARRSTEPPSDATPHTPPGPTSEGPIG